MSRLQRWLIVCIAGWLVTLPIAHAHLIVSQRGTLNIVGNGAYMVLSLPVSAFTGIDDNGDRRLSLDELRSHAQSIEAQVQQSVYLVSDQGTHALEGLMLNSSPLDDATTAPAEQILVMGRFPLDPQIKEITFSLSLFGIKTTEQVEQITVTRGSETQLMTLTPQRNQVEVLPSVWTIFVDQATNGATHIFFGVDHLLFLLVVLATGWDFWKILLALTCFTLGHAITLLASAWFGLAVSPTLVEPAIAATIVAVALFDRWYYLSKANASEKIRLVLIFGCALIHGLGLAEAFSDLGLNSENKLLSMAGFNTGIELGQLTVALFAVALMKTIRTFRGAAGLAMAMQLASYAAILLGAFWFVERIAFTT